MPKKNKKHEKTATKSSNSLEKQRLHQRNKNRERYNFKQLIEKSPELAQFVKLNTYKAESIDFADQDAVKALNKALLKTFYDIDFWDIPANYLCPPIPGRADYIHYIADLLCQNNYGKIPTGTKIKCLDIGVGANCIYPIIGNHEYGWSFVGSEIDPVSIDSANKIIEQNSSLKGKVECRIQENSKDIFNGIIKDKEQFDITICNPPFHSSAKDANAASLRKLSNLNLIKENKPNLNFGGQSNELWCEGGEEGFVTEMILQSRKLSSACFWFSTLISKQTSLKKVYSTLRQENAIKVETIPMGQGNKTSRIVAWSFLSEDEQKVWRNIKWNNQKPKEKK